MSQPELEPKAVQISVTTGDASNLPMYHVNALNLRASSDEFFFTLALAEIPDQAEATALTVDGQIKVVAQPIFRFAVSRDTMEKFLALMAGTFDQQSRLRERMPQQSSETSEEE